jgi:hypothetical protein
LARREPEPSGREPAHYDAIQPELLPGGRFAGFRHATVEEVALLFRHAGWDPSLPPQGSNTAAARDLQQKIGITFGVLDYNFTRGFTSTTTPSGNVVLATVVHQMNFGGTGHFCAAMDCESYGPDELPSNPLVGHFLVRVVPEPTTAPLLASGLAALAYRARSRGSRALAA